tara:strand:+ start:175 stop:900 length:726 start_codon:yes stop_codon:yes gene_type:complete
MLMTEVDSYEETSYPKRRPNTMNRLGLIVNDIGLEKIMNNIVVQLIGPICKYLYPSEMTTSQLDSHHSFIVQYKAALAKQGDAGLDMHHDASEATLNVCLGRNFSGSGLRFCGAFGATNHRKMSHVHQHQIGQAVLHLGKHRHGADNITSGERLNLIVWARNSTFRGAAAFGHVHGNGFPKQKEIGQPDQLCLSKTNDRDYEERMKDYCVKMDGMDGMEERPTKKAKVFGFPSVGKTCTRR